MKIRTDKIDDGPPHSLNAQDVRLILATVPLEWIEGLVEVRLANAPGPRAYLMHSEGRLIIYSRYSTERDFEGSSVGTRRALAEHYECRIP